MDIYLGKSAAAVASLLWDWRRVFVELVRVSGQNQFMEGTGTATLDKKIRNIADRRTFGWSKSDLVLHGFAFQYLGADLGGGACEFSVRDIVRRLSVWDPTPRKKALDWLTNHFRLGQLQKLEPEVVSRSIAFFFSRRELFRSSGMRPCIDDFTPMELVAETDIVVDRLGRTPFADLSSELHLLHSGPLGALASPLTENAAIRLGKGTKWCTAKRTKNPFRFLSSDEFPLYVWWDSVLVQKFQFHWGSVQFKCISNEDVPERLLHEWRCRHPVLSSLFRQEEAKVFTASRRAARYASLLGKSDFPEVIDLATRNPWYAQRYMMFRAIRLRHLEASVLKDPLAAALHAKHVVGERWLAAEPEILKSTRAIVEYAQHVIGGRWQEAERYLLSDPDECVSYAINVVKAPWPEAEGVIFSSAATAKTYNMHFGTAATRSIAQVPRIADCSSEINRKG